MKDLLRFLYPDAPPAGFPPVTQSEGLPVKVGKGLAEAAEREQARHGISAQAKQCRHGNGAGKRQKASAPSGSAPDMPELPSFLQRPFRVVA
jgi:hypothetical protein